MHFQNKVLLTELQIAQNNNICKTTEKQLERPC